MALAWKAGWVNSPRGFESRILRHVTMPGRSLDRPGIAASRARASQFGRKPDLFPARVNGLRHNRGVQTGSDLRGPWLLLAALRFLAELAMLVALAYVGWRLAGDTQVLGAVLAVLLVGLAASVWGRWVAPRSEARLEDPLRFAVEVALFGAAVVGLAVVGAWPAALGLAAAYAVSTPVGRRGL